MEEIDQSADSATFMRTSRSDLDYSRIKVHFLYKKETKKQTKESWLEIVWTTNDICQFPDLFFKGHTKFSKTIDKWHTGCHSTISNQLCMFPWFLSNPHFSHFGTYQNVWNHCTTNRTPYNFQEVISFTFSNLKLDLALLYQSFRPL